MNMKHHDYQQIQSRWRKEQQLIGKKFQISYSMTSTSPSCQKKSITLLSTTNFSSNRKRKPNQRCSNDDSHIPPMFCAQCHSNPMKCQCSDGIGQWWSHLHRRSSSLMGENTREKKSRSHSLSIRHVNFERSLIDLSSIEQSISHKANFLSHSPQYVLLNWNDRSSLLKFLHTTQSIRNISHLSIEQLRHQIITNTSIHLFQSITDLFLTLSKEQQRISLCQIYIDPSYYSTRYGTDPFSQSHLIADNYDLNRTLYSIRKISNLLGVNIDQHANDFSFENRSTKQRKSILSQHSLFLASKMPSNIFQHSPTPSHILEAKKN